MTNPRQQRKPRFAAALWVVLVCLFAGCSSGTVVFAPTPPPPDLSPMRYTHPGGAFSLVAPRHWTLHEQNTTALASAAFSIPGETEPSLLFVVMNPGIELNSQTFGDLITQYQTQVRPDVERYTEQSRQAMGDGSWRMTGIRHTPLGVTQQVNTFIEYSGDLIGIIDVVLPDDIMQRYDLQAIVNSFEINPDAALQAAPLSSLTVASPTGLSLLHVSTWTTPAGVFFITGEVANYGGEPVANIPIKAVLRSSDGLNVAEAEDLVMGYGVPPGGFAPFSLRFGQGQPALAQDYELILGGQNWQPETGAQLLHPEALVLTSESSREQDGRLIVSGTVRNVSEQTAREVRVTISVFNTEQQVIAAGFTQLEGGALPPNAEAPYQIVVPEMGGEPANFIVTAQGLS